MRVILLFLIVALSFGQEKSLPLVKLKDLKNQTQSLENIVDGKITLINRKKAANTKEVQ